MEKLMGAGEEAHPRAGRKEAERRRDIGLMMAMVFVGLSIGIGLTYLLVFFGLGGVPLSILAIFAIAMLIGIAGASVYVVVQVISDKELSVLKNLLEQKYVGRGVMLFLFLLSGGLVSAMSQASVGSFQPGNIWTSFLIGFGWQGVISGVGGSAAIRAKDSEGQEKLEQLATTFKEELQRVRSQAGPKLGVVVPEGSP